MQLHESDVRMTLAAIAGVAFAWERWATHPDRMERLPRQHSPAQRVGLLIVVAGFAAIDAVTVRGFLYLLLMPIGAYKVAQLASEPFFQRRAELRALLARWKPDQIGSKPAE